MRIPFFTALLVPFLVSLSACSGGAGDTNGNSSSGGVDLLGAGATFPYPLYARWFNQYANETGIRVNYQSIGSGGGIRQLIAGTVDFGATDVPMLEEEIARVPEGHVIHIPTVLGAVAVTYHVPELEHALRLSPDVLADMFLGKITRWDDPRITAINPGATLPSRDVLVVHRSDGSGTTYIFTDFLTRTSSAWAAGPGKSKDIRWPVGLGGKGNEGVAGQVKQMPGSISYVEATYARQNRLPVALLQNSSGNFVGPSSDEMAAAALSAIEVAEVSDDLTLSIVNAPGENAYPISSFTWILVAPQLIGAEKSATFAKLVGWALTEGGEVANEMGYGPLPPDLTSRILAMLDAQLGNTNTEEQP